MGAKETPVICVLCHQSIDLWDLTDWQGEPVHTWCGQGAVRAWIDALEYAARERAKRDSRRMAA